ncbi:MAG: NAD(P)H-dependent oxidoreductase [bacterium]
MAKKIKLIVGSTRQGRVGGHIATWLVGVAKDAGVELEVVDLKEENLPFFEGPSPAYVPATTPEGQAWSAKIKEAEAVIFLTAEYNRGIPAPLKNAIDHLYNEWTDKPAGIVAYGYVDAGVGVISQLKQVLSWIKMRVAEPTVGILLARDHLENGNFKDVDSALDHAKAPFLAVLEAINAA